ncbi:MAG: hypothetical protein KGH52_04455, partial [Candidatus Micrarchaeota archaeon]|nr:hypothetical protein [Candidatus Micrarchaeota archaeon]
SNTSPYNQAYYAPASNANIGSWTATNSYPIGASLSSCNIYQNYIYCVAGVGSGAGTNLVYYAPLLNPGIGAWQATTSYPMVQYGESCIIPGNGGGYLGSGYAPT